MNNILVVNVNWLGDVIFSSPVFRALKEAYPQARIICLAVPRVKEILESIPFIDEIIIYDEKGKHASLTAKLGLIYYLRKKSFDIAFLLHRSLTRALFVFLAGIPRRVGYDTKGRGFFLTHKVKPLAGEAHRSDHYLHVIESYGISVRDRRTQLNVTSQSKEEVSGMLTAENVRPEDEIVVINPGGNWDLKRWPVENFAKLVDHLMNEGRWKVVIAGAPQDVPLFETIISHSKDKPINLTGKTTLKQLMALMQRARLVISADSGPLHLASSVGTDVIGIFGPTRPEITGPRGSGRGAILQHDVGCNRKACYHLKCPDNICMKSISVEDVLTKFNKIIE